MVSDADRAAEAELGDPPGLVAGAPHLVPELLALAGGPRAV